MLPEEWCCGEQRAATPGHSVTQTCLHTLIPSFLLCHGPSCTQGWFLIPVPFSLQSLPPLLRITPSFWPPKHLPPLSFEAQSPSFSPWHSPKYPSPAPSLHSPAPAPACPVIHLPVSPQAHHLSCFCLYLPTPSLVSPSSLDPTIPVLHIPGPLLPHMVTVFSLFQSQKVCPSTIPFPPIWSLPLCSALQVDAFLSPSCLGNGKGIRKAQKQQALSLQPGIKWVNLSLL